jgi:uncharacterized protein (TIGR03435 family)
MKRTFLHLAAATIALTTALHAQTIAGTWQGTLPARASQRVVLKIEKSPDGSLRGGLIRIDSSADGLPLTSVVFTAPDLTFEAAFGVTFKGKLAPDGHSIEGTWTQFQQSYPLTLTLATPDTQWRHEGLAAISPMSSTADPAFEVALIKPTRPDENNTLFDLRSRKFTAQHTSAKELIKIAYNVRGRQVLGGPPWLEDTKFDVTAEPDTPGIPSEDQNRLMVKKLLQDRFQLKLHIDRQIFPILAVTMDPKAHPLTPSDPEFNGHGTISSRMTADGQLAVNFAGETIPQLVSFIMNIFQQSQLVDETGLTGTYDFTLTIPLSELQGPSASADPDAQGEAFITAAKQIGFRFTPKKEPLEVIVVDHIDKPSPN